MRATILTVACPFFYPVSKFEETGFTVQPRFPLGAAYLGECRAAAVSALIKSDCGWQNCNSGYGRSSCASFPREAEIDAVRFHIRQDDRLLQVQFVMESSGWPKIHGLLEYSLDGQQFVRSHSDPTILRQAEVYVENYLRRKAE